MISQEIINKVCFGWIALALVIFPLLLKTTQPYGRHINSGWGPTINNSLAWFLMESPALVIFLFYIIQSVNFRNYLVVIAAFLWVLHYFHRSIIYPHKIRTRNKTMPVVIMLFGITFNIVNGFLNGYWLAELAPEPKISVLFIIRMIIGVVIFLSGFIINKYHDRLLIQLRDNGTDGYKIPFGGLFKYVSCPNFLGEIISWIGFALLTLSLPALSFVIWTIINLIPRALDHHKWYKKEFADYPKNRKSIIPFIV